MEWWHTWGRGSFFTSLIRFSTLIDSPYFNQIFGFGKINFGVTGKPTIHVAVCHEAG
jgi:hypothetical protein